MHMQGMQYVSEFCNSAKNPTLTGPCLRIVIPKSSLLLGVFYGQKVSVLRIVIKKCFLFMVGSVCLVKQFTNGLRNMAKVSLMTG